MAKSHSLGPTDWIKAAFRALTADGINGVRVEKLARSLGVTKGSFYWHFEDLPALQRAMLEHWKDVATEEVIQRAQITDASLEDFLTGLLAEAVSNPAEEYGGAMAETAIREWARTDERAARSVEHVDQRRLSFLAERFGQTGCNQRESQECALLFYATLIGIEQVSHLARLRAGTIESFAHRLAEITASSRGGGD